MIGVVYSRRTGRIRSIIVPDPGERLRVSVGPGEEFLEFPDLANSTVPDLVALQVALNGRTGKTPANDRYAVVDGNDVVAVLYADPACGDAIPGRALVAHDHAGQGWKRQGAGLVPPDPQG